MLLTCDGSRPIQLLRTINLSHFLIQGGVAALTDVLEVHQEGQPVPVPLAS